MECEGAEVSVLFTADSEMRKLNANFRGKDKPTDVLSFALSEGEALTSSGYRIADQKVVSGPRGRVSPILGDIVISVVTAKRQAKEFCVSLREELLRLLIHGLLHLLGYDHEGVSKREADAMRRKERELMALMS